MTRGAAGESCAGGTSFEGGFLAGYRGMKPTTHQVLAERNHPPYDDRMAPNILIRSVPGDVHQTLTRRASDAGQSLQEYLLEMLREVTSRPTMQEIVSWPEREGPGSRSLGATTQEIVEEIRAQRQR